MIEQPFAIFRPFEDRVRVRLYDRGDAVMNAADVTRLEGLPVADGEQTHGPLSERVLGPGTVAGADGIATDVRGLALASRNADCQSFAVFDPARGVGGVLHTGWKGLLNGAIPAFAHLLHHEWGSDPRNLLVGAGPSLCTTCAEFTDPAAELAGIDPRFFYGRLANLRAIADDQWEGAGVMPECIERHPDCTKCSVDRWWSLRGGDKEFLRQGFRNAMTFSLK